MTALNFLLESVWFSLNQTQASFAAIFATCAP